VEDDVVVFRCKWPFDLDTNEWIEIENQFDRVKYVRAIESLIAHGAVKIEGKGSGYLALAAVAPNRIRLEVVAGGRERVPELHNLTLNLSAADLLPRVS